MHGDVDPTVLAPALVAAAAIAAIVPVWRNRDRRRDRHGWWARALALSGLASLAGLQLVEIVSFPGAGRTDAWTLVSVACVVAALAAREALFRRTVAERERAEGQLETQQRLLQTCFDALPHVMAVKDPDARLLMVNKAFCELTGADPERFRGMRVAEVGTIAPEDSAPVEPEDELVLSGAREIVETERRHADREGGIRDYHVIKVPLRDDSGRLDGMVVIGLDITDRKVAERALADSQRLLQDVFDAIPHFVAVKDRDGRYQMVNQSYADTFGVSQESAAGLTPVEMVDRDEEEMRQVFEDDRAVLSGARTRYCAERWRHDRSGERLLTEITKAPLRDAAGGVAGVVSVGIDISERRRTEDELATYRDGLEERVARRTDELRAAQDELVRSERLAAIGRLTATVSHELRNPLGTISATFYAVRKLIGRSEAEIEARMSRIERNIQRCVKIVDDLLDYTRLPAMRLVPTDIDDWLGEICAELPVPPGIEFRVTPGSAARVSIDRERVTRAVTNLVENACLSIVEQGAPETAVTIDVTSALGGDRVAITVRDSGPGISAEVLPHVFEPLFSTRSFGIGLGLPMVKEVAELHGGGVDVQSTPGGGTTATIWVPATPRGRS